METSGFQIGILSLRENEFSMAIYTFEARVLVSGTVEAASEDAAEELLNDELYAETWSGDIDITWSDIRVDDVDYDFDANDEFDDDDDDEDDLSDDYAVSADQPVLF
jgi:hypothetical protein